MDFTQLTVTEITGIATIPSPKGRRGTIFNRQTYGLSFCLEGQITYTLNGKSYVSDKNHAIILPQGQTYSLYGDKKGVFPLINFTCAEFFTDTHIVLPISSTEPFIRDFEQMKRLLLIDGNRLKVLGIFYNILHRLTLQGAENNVLTPALKYLEQNYSDPGLSNARLAAECAISEVYFRKLFTKQYKMTPKQFVTDLRINRAKQLLAEGALKINAVSEECGFASPYHFDRIFKQKTGLTPTEYMKQNMIFKI